MPFTVFVFLVVILALSLSVMLLFTSLGRFPSPILGGIRGHLAAIDGKQFVA